MAVDVIVIGSGCGGAWAARDLAENGLRVKVFESGPRYNPDTDFKEDVIEMWGFFGWKGPRVHVGQGVGNMSTGVGGSTLDYWGMSPQPQNFAVDEWHPLLRNDMFGTTVDPYTGYYVPIRFFDWIDNRIPIDKRQDRPISCGAQKCIEAASDLGYTAGRCPAAMLPPKYERVDAKGYPLEGCLGCAHCTIGCRRPLHMPLHAKAKRTMQVAAIAFAEMYDCEVVSNAHVTRITTDGSGAANGVEYKITGDPTTYSESAPVVFIGGGAIESVRLYLNSGLPEPNPGQPQVGHWLTDHQQSEVAFFLNDGEALPFTGNFVGAFITNPTPTDQLDGIIEAIGGGFPMVGVNVIQSYPQKDPDNLSQPHPTRQVIWGQEFKEMMARFRYATGMGTQTNDEMVYENYITVSDSVADEYGPVAEIHYEPTPLTLERHERQTARKVDFARQAAGPNAEIVMNYPGGTGSHPLGTLKMGDSQLSSVCDMNQECWTVPRLYVCDASVLPNGLGGSNPARTINAFASRAAYYAMKKYFPTQWASRTWPW
jgi:choline dehydrogenase-like flavoprotein